MALDFPQLPIQGQIFTDPATGVVWVFDNGKWRGGAGGGAYLPLSGGTLTGPLSGATGAFSGVVSGADPPAGDSSGKLATTAWINANARYGDNRIINGDMRIDQRNNGASGTANGYTVDRWQYSGSQVSRGNWQRVTNAPSAVIGFPYALAFTSSSAYAVVAADVFAFYQLIEADMVSDFAWGTAQAQSATLSFWALSTLSGVFGGSVRNYAATRSYPFSFSLTANNWTKVVITIPGDSAGTWVMSGNAASINVAFGLGVGSTYSGPANAWASTNYVAPLGAVSVVGTNGASFSLTGVKLEIGSVATPFNRQSLTKSLADCQRYFFAPSGVAWASGYASVAAGLTVFAMRTFPVTMRVTPTQSGVQYNLNNANTPTVSSMGANIWTFAATNTAVGAFQFNINQDTYSAEL